MRRRRSIEAADDSNEVNLTPMLDVVFIMLIKNGDHTGDGAQQPQ